MGIEHFKIKKILGIIVLGLIFYINPLTIHDSNAGWFSDPMEKCMDRLIKGTYNNNEQYSAVAAKFCKGADKSTDKCMDRLIKGTYNNKESYSVAAAKMCLGN